MRLGRFATSAPRRASCRRAAPSYALWPTPASWCRSRRACRKETSMS